MRKGETNTQILRNEQKNSSFSDLGMVKKRSRKCRKENRRKNIFNYHTLINCQRREK